MSLHDLTPLFAQPAMPALEFRQGTIISFDSVTGENRVSVGGIIVDNVSLLNTTGAPILVTGDIVGLLRSRTQYFILGRILVPPY